MIEHSTTCQIRCRSQLDLFWIVPQARFHGTIGIGNEWQHWIVRINYIITNQVRWSFRNSIRVFVNRILQKCIDSLPETISTLDRLNAIISLEPMVLTKAISGELDVISMLNRSA